MSVGPAGAATNCIILPIRRTRVAENAIPIDGTHVVYVTCTILSSTIPKPQTPYIHRNGEFSGPLFSLALWCHHTAMYSCRVVYFVVSDRLFNVLAHVVVVVVVWWVFVCSGNALI